MKFAKLGKRISAVEVTNVSQHGFWLLIGKTERFVEFSRFPWFRQARIGDLMNVELQSPRHLYWPDLDVDLAVESIDHPEWTAPMISKARPARELLPKIFGARIAANMLKPRGRPKFPDSGVAINRAFEETRMKPRALQRG